MINLTAVIDNADAIRKLKELKETAQRTTSNIVTDADRIDFAMRKIGQGLAGLGLGISLTGLARQVANVRGEFQQLEVAFSTMLQSKEKADALMAEVTDFAAKTPFDLQGVAQGTKQLLAYGSTAEEVVGELRMLGDIAAGLSLPLGDLVYLYGTTRTQGRMYTQDLRQFMGRGIPLAEELAKQFGVTKDKIGELVTAGKVGFEEMRQALVAMTSDGGKFYNLMEAQSATITGKMSNLGDAIDQMFNDIGKSTEGFIASALDGVTWVVENYEKVGRVLMDIVAAYGSYKAAVIAVTVWQKAERLLLKQMAVEKAILAAANHTVTASQLRAAAASKLFAAAQLKVKTAIRGLGAMLTNPYVLATAAIAGAVYAVYELVTAKSVEARAQEALNEKLKEYNEASQQDREEANQLITTIANTTAAYDERITAVDKLIEKYPALLDKYTQEKLLLMDIKELQQVADLEQAEEKISYLKTRINNVKRETAAAIRANETWYEKLDRSALTYMPEGTQEEKEIDLFSRYYGKEYWNAVNANTKRYSQDLAEAYKERARVQLKALPVETQISELERVLAKVKATPNAAQVTILGGTWDVEDFTREFQAKVNGLKALTKQTETIVNEEEQKQLAKARQDALKSAFDAEIALRKELIADKVELLKYEKELELATIDERLKAVTDAQGKPTDVVTYNALMRERVATEGLYDEKIAKANADKAKEEAENYRRQQEEQKRHLDQMLGEFGTYIQKREAIIEAYREKENSMYTTDENGNIIRDSEGTPQLKEGFTTENVDILRTERDESLEQLVDDYFADDQQFKEWLDTIVGLSLETLKKEKAALESMMEGITDETLRGYMQAQVNAIGDLIESNEQESDDTTKSQRWANMAQAINAVGDAAKDALDNIEGMDEGVKKFLSDTLNIANSLGNLVIAIQQYKEIAGAVDKASDAAAAGASELATAIDGVSKSASALDKASAVLMIISAVIQVASALFTAFNKTSSMEKNLETLMRFNNELRRLKQEAKLSGWEDTIFGGDGFGKAAHALDVYSEALERYNKRLQETIFKLNNQADFMPTFGAWNQGISMSPESNYEDLEDVLRGMQIQTRHSTWFRSTKYANLEDVLPELFGEDGVDMAMLKEFINNEMFQHLSVEHQELIKDLVADWELYEDALSEVKDYLSSVFGDLGGEMTDALVSAFQSGTDAAKDFTESVSTMLETFAKDMVHTLIFADLFTGAQDALMEVMKDANLTDDVKFAKYAQIFGHLVNQSADMQDEAFALMAKLQAAAEEYGFDIFNDADKQTATQRGFQAMSQETGSELNGRFTDMQGKMTEIRDFVFTEIVNGQNRLNELVNIRDIAIQLNGNVEQIKTYSKVLPEINDTLSSMNRKLDSI